VRRVHIDHHETGDVLGKDVGSMQETERMTERRASARGAMTFRVPQVSRAA